MPFIHHAERDHPFLAISRGHLTWARATSPAIRPEVKTPKRVFTPVQNLANCILTPIAHELLREPVVIPEADSDKSVRDSISQLEKTIERFDATIAISDRFNQIYAGLRQKVRHAR